MKEELLQTELSVLTSDNCKKIVSLSARQWRDAMPPQPNQSDWSQRLSVNCQWRADAEWMQRFRAQP
ncbi:hypothetical protein, partial [Stenotrophomonas maltophilia group sp. RNC7]|uniref:hypothetical protein n=1 Tax=Stenotrophomonas maltophilia group sp. RNC7 TaxID=3071467 RepID=UPI0027DF1468